MIRLLKSDYTTLDIPEASSVTVEGRQVICRDPRGQVVRQFPVNEITVYIQSPELIALLDEQLPSGPLPGVT
jgi:hypothetical protein